MKKVTTLILLLICSISFSQQEDNANKGRWIFGGNFGVGFGSNSYTAIAISPSVGYLLPSGLELGAQAGYQYNQNNIIRTNLFSVGPYVNYYFLQNFFARTQYIYYTGNLNYRHAENSKTTIDDNAWWVGGGYHSGVGSVRFQVGVMYNILHDNNSFIFANAFMPYAGVGIGF